MGLAQRIYRIQTLEQPVYILADESRARLYVSHPMNNAIGVIDALNRKVLGYISVGAYPGFAALNLNEQILVTANYADSTLTVIDLERNNLAHTLTTGRQPRHVAIAPSGRVIGSCNSGADSVTVVHVTDRRVTRTVEIPVGKGPEEIIFSADNDRAYVLCRGDDSVYFLDIPNSKVSAVATLRYEMGYRPAALCHSATTNQLFVACSTAGRVEVLNEGGRVVESLSVGTVPVSIYALSSVPWICVLDSIKSCVYLIDPVCLQIAHCIGVGAVPLTIVEMVGRSLLVVISFASQTASLIDLMTCTELERIPLARRPFGPAVIEKLGTVFIASEDEHCVVGYAIPPKFEA